LTLTEDAAAGTSVAPTALIRGSGQTRQAMPTGTCTEYRGLIGLAEVSIPGITWAAIRGGDDSPAGAALASTNRRGLALRQYLMEQRGKERPIGLQPVSKIYSLFTLLFSNMLNTFLTQCVKKSLDDFAAARYI